MVGELLLYWWLTQTTCISLEYNQIKSKALANVIRMLIDMLIRINILVENIALQYRIASFLWQNFDLRSTNIKAVLRQNAKNYKKKKKINSTSIKDMDKLKWNRVNGWVNDRWEPNRLQWIDLAENSCVADYFIYFFVAKDFQSKKQTQTL